MTNTLVRVGFAGILLVAAPALFTESLTAQAISPALAAERVQVLQLEQCQVQRDVRAMPRDRGPAREDAIRALRETKDRMHAQLVGLEAGMDASPELQAAFDAIRESRLTEKLLFSRGTIEQWDDGSELRVESIIQQDLARVRGELAPGAAPVQCAAPV
jgi:hypothetical protein